MAIRALRTLLNLEWEEMTKEERVRLMLADSDAYMEKVPPGHWLDILDGIAKGGPIRE